jgi:hypothetical protein
VPIAAEALAEAARVARRVAEHDPDDDRVLVGQRALGDFPHLVVDVRALVIDHEDQAADIVQAGEGLGVVGRPGDEIEPPAILVPGSFALIFIVALA